MRLSLIVLLACSTLSCIFALPTATTGRTVKKTRNLAARDVSIAITDLSWPVSATGFKAKRFSGLSNAERLRRGLTPRRPTKLYKPKAKKAATNVEVTPRGVRASRLGLHQPKAKRILDAPSQGVTVSNTYRFVGCYAPETINLQSGGTDQAVEFTDNQDFANQCAVQQDQAANVPDRIPGFTLSRDFGCSTLAGPQGGASSVPCTVDTYAVYTQEFE